MTAYAACSLGSWGFPTNTLGVEATQYQLLAL